MNKSQYEFIHRSISIPSYLLILIYSVVLFYYSLVGVFSENSWDVYNDLYLESYYYIPYNIVFIFSLLILSSYLILCYSRGIKKQKIGYYSIGLSAVPFSVHWFCFISGVSYSGEVEDILPETFSSFFYFFLLPNILFISSILYRKYSRLIEDNRTKYSYLYLYRCFSYPSYLVACLFSLELFNISTAYDTCLATSGYTSTQWDMYVNLYSRRVFYIPLNLSTFFALAPIFVYYFLLYSNDLYEHGFYIFSFSHVLYILLLQIFVVLGCIYRSHLKFSNLDVQIITDPLWPFVYMTAPLLIALLMVWSKKLSSLSQ